MNLAELVAALERRAAEAEAIGATAPAAAIYRQLAGEVAGIAGNGTAGGTGAQPQADRLLTAHEVATRLQCSVRYVYARAEELPFTVRLGKLVRFSEAGLEQWLARRAA